MSRKKAEERDEAKKALAAQSPQRGGGVQERELVARRGSDIPQKAIEWLWLGHYPCGKLTAIAGNPGLGKSQVALDAVRCVTTGADWPDGAKGSGVGANVVILDAEDDAEDTMMPRLDFMGADLSKITVIEASQPIGDDTRRSPVNLINDIDALETKIDEIGNMKLLILDPLNEYMGGVKTERDGEVRGALLRLRMLAAEKKFAVLLIMHLNKSEQQSAIQRISGSMAFAALIRKGFFVIPGKDRATDRLFIPAKSNVGVIGMSLSFTIEAENNDPNTARTKIAWGASMGFLEIDQIMTEQAKERVIGGGGSGGRSARTYAMDMLRMILRDDPKPVKEVEGQLEALGVPLGTTVQRARSQLGVEAVKDKKRKGGWVLKLPLRKFAVSPPPKEGKDAA